MTSVWIIDDDDDDLFFMGTAFHTHHPSISVVPIRDGAELMPKLANCISLPKLIILDLNMPRKSGFVLLDELRSFPQYAAVPVLVFTNSTELKDHQRALALGANHYRIKPNFYEQLESMVDELIDQWELGISSKRIMAPATHAP